MAEVAAAAEAARVQAVRSFGVVVRVDPEAFLDVLARVKDPLVVTSVGGLFTTKYKYLVSYKGLAFHTVSTTPLELPDRAEVIAAKDVAVP